MPGEQGYTLWSRNGDDSECDDTELIKMWDNSMETFMEEMKKKKAGSAAKTEWNVGDFCRAKYRRDGQWYEAEVVKKLPQKRLVVEFIGYGDHEEIEACMLRASKGQACRELQKEEVMLAQFEDEEDSEDEESGNQEEELAPKKENHVALPEDEPKEERGPEKPRDKKTLEFVAPKDTEPKEKKNRTPIMTPMSSFISTEQKEEEELSALRKKSIQNRKLKSVSRSGGEPYSVPEGNHSATHTPLQRGLESHYLPKESEPYVPRNEPRSYMARNEPQPYTSRSEPQPYSSRSEPQPYMPRSETERFLPRNEPQPYMPHSESFPYAPRHEPQPYGSRPDAAAARSFDQTAAEIKAMISNLSQRSSMFNSRGGWEDRIPPRGMPSSYLPPPPSYAYRGIPDIRPPAPSSAPFSAGPCPPMASFSQDDMESLTSLLSSWYLNGYNTGYYMGLRNARQDNQRYPSRHHT